jgi:hypothetical protein
MCIHNVLSVERWIDHYGDVLVESSFGNKARISFIQVRFIVFFYSMKIQNLFLE